MNIWEKIESWIAKDKLEHFFYGFLLFELLTIFFDGHVSLLIVFFIAIAKEFLIDKVIRKKTPDLFDFVFTIMPGSIILIIQSW